MSKRTQTRTLASANPEPKPKREQLENGIFFELLNYFENFGSNERKVIFFD